MINLTSSTNIYRPIHQVFDYVSEPENDFQWQYGTLASSRLSEGVSMVGSFFRSIGHLMGRRVLGTYEVTEYEPDRKYRFKSLSGPVNSQTTFTFELMDGSTRVNVAMQIDSVDFVAVEGGMFEKRMKKQMKENLALLKDLLEAKQVLAAS